MEETIKFRTSNVVECLKAINDYVNINEAVVTKGEHGQLREKAKKATEHLSILFSPEAGNVFLESCPLEDLPTIL